MLKAINGARHVDKSFWIILNNFMLLVMPEIKILMLYAELHNI